MKRTVAKLAGKCTRREASVFDREALDAKVALIQALIPLGLQAVAETLEAEVTALAGARYQRHDPTGVRLDLLTFASL